MNNAGAFRRFQAVPCCSPGIIAIAKVGFRRKAPQHGAPASLRARESSSFRIELFASCYANALRKPGNSITRVDVTN